MTTPLLEIENLKKNFPLPRRRLFGKAPQYRAIRGINLKVRPGVSFGIVGESGCGKSTLARIVMALQTPSEGTVYFQGQNLFKIKQKELIRLRRQFQMVFQDPYGSLNPRKTIQKIVAEPLKALKTKRDQKEILELVGDTLIEVGLKQKDGVKYPHEFSGGQRQRIAIARALITRPSLIVADEPVSALDVSVQAQVLNLMMDLQDKYRLTYLFISHDLSVVEYITDEIAVIYNGKIVEQGATPDVFNTPRHPYTKALLAAIPDINPRQKPDLVIRPAIETSSPQSGCPYQFRCEKSDQHCVTDDPALINHDTHLVACHYA